jgi:hypothetical protein
MQVHNYHHQRILHPMFTHVCWPCVLQVPLFSAWSHFSTLTPCLMPPCYVLLGSSSKALRSGSCPWVAMLVTCLLATL